MDEEQLRRIISAIENQDHSTLQNEIDKLKNRIALVEVLKIICTPKMI